MTDYVYIPDEKPGMSNSEKNMQLSSELAKAPNNERNIVKICSDADDSGWDITYQA